jgi:hypothetical protein
MPVHQPVHEGVHQPNGGAVPSGQALISASYTMNRSVHYLAVHQFGDMASGQASGQNEPSIFSGLTSLSTIFLLKSQKRRMERKMATAKDTRAKGGQVDKAHHP